MSHAPTTPGTLFVVGTPIGNLQDLSARALQTLREVDGVICEDTRHTRNLLTRHGLAPALHSLPAFAEAQRTGPLVEKLLGGRSLALVTDAGMPGVSDPGALLVRAAAEAGVRVVPIPGPSAVLAAIAGSGLQAGRFTFLGFLPRKGTARRELIEASRRLPAALVLFESPRRLHDTLLELAELLGERQACVARELTKLHEELARGTLLQLAQRFSGEVLGEVTIVIEGAAAEEPEPLDPDDALRAALSGGASVKDAAREVAEALSLPRREVYQRALQLHDEPVGRDEGERLPEDVEGG